MAISSTRTKSTGFSDAQAPKYSNTQNNNSDARAERCDEFAAVKHGSFTEQETQKSLRHRLQEFS